MSSALDQFERALVDASRSLSTSETAMSGHRIGPSRRLGPRTRSLGIAAPLGLAGGLGVAAAAAAAGYLLLSNAPASGIAGYECQTSRQSTAIIQPITGNPLIDCAAAWPSATAGRSSAPPLTAWASTRQLSAVVIPTSQGRPGPSWRRLPATWTLQLPVAILTDQLNDIAAPFAQRCTREQTAVNAARRLLDADHLSGWTVAVHTRGIPASACAPTTADADGDSKTVQITRLQPAPRSAPRRTPSRLAALANHRTLLRLQSTVNRTLSRECVTVVRAATLWRQAAAAAEVNPATLDYWRTLNRRPTTRRVPQLHYTLYRQPASQHTGRCAHILAIGNTDIPTVYAARLAP